MKLLGVNHAQISIPKGSEGEARRFYCDFLGLVEIQKPDSLQGRGGFWATVGGFQVHFGAEVGFDPRATRSHIAYEVADLGAWRVRLMDRGIEAKEGIPIPGYDRFEFRDPFGNRVEFMQTKG